MDKYAAKEWLTGERNAICNEINIVGWINLTLAFDSWDSIGTCPSGRRLFILVYMYTVWVHQPYR